MQQRSSGLPLPVGEVDATAPGEGLKTQDRGFCPLPPLRGTLSLRARDRLPKSVFQILFGFDQAGGLAQITPVEFIGTKTEDVFAVGRQTEIGVDDRKHSVLRKHLQKAWRDDVDAGKGQRVPLVGWTRNFRWPIGSRSSSAQS